MKSNAFRAPLLATALGGVVALAAGQAHAQAPKPVQPPVTNTTPPTPTQTAPTPTQTAPTPTQTAPVAPSTTAPAADTEAPVMDPSPPPSSPPPAPTPPPPPASEPPPPPSSRDDNKLVDHLEAGGWLGWGIKLDGQETNPFGFALGARGAAVLPNHIYLGLTLGIFAGQSQDIGYYEYSLWQTQVGVEGGYDLDLGALTLRPFVGLGLNHTINSISTSYGLSSTTYNTASATDAFLNVGGMAHLNLTKRIYGGVDTHLTFVTSAPARAALVVAASGGVRFF